MQFLSDRGYASDVAQNAGMIVSELTENAVKYGAFEGKDDAIQIAVKPHGDSFQILVTCPIGSRDSEHVARLGELLARIQDSDPLTAFVDRLREITEEDPKAKEGSGLGLLRIAYEGQSRLNFECANDNRLTVLATYSA